jgi:hypothetical protein
MSILESRLPRSEAQSPVRNASLVLTLPLENRIEIVRLAASEKAKAAPPAWA